MNDYFSKDYDVIVIGAALATLTSALDLAKEGLRVLVLEANDNPGGLTTSYMRDGIEIEATLHEMLNIGTKENPLRVRRFLESNGVNVDWVRIPDAFRYVSPHVDIVVHSGVDGDFEPAIKDIASACPDPEDAARRLRDFFALADQVFQSGSYLIDHKINVVKTYLNHRGYVETAGYSFTEVTDAFGLPDIAKEILSAYWTYLGSPMDDVPFAIYGYIIAGYIGYGAYVPRHTSYEMSAGLAKRCQELGVHIEYGQKVSKILVKNGRTCGVRLSSGLEVYAPYIVSGAYPHAVYSSMIEPLSEVPAKAKRWANAMELGPTAFSLILLLDEDPKTLGITDYCLFYDSLGEGDKVSREKGFGDGDWDYLTILCPNIVLPEASPTGTCLYNIVYLPSPRSFEPIAAEEYEDYKTRHAKHLIDVESKRLGVDLTKHIKDIFFETPISISHYVHAYAGGVYGYRHRMADNITARAMDRDNEHYIEGLAFSGAHGVSGDGMAPAFDNGLDASAYIKKLARKEGRK